MWPTIVEFHAASGTFPVHTWGLMILVAFLFASAMTQRRAASAGVEAENLIGFYVVAFVAGLVGARLLHFLMAEPEKFFADPFVFLRFWEGGFAFYGGAILATLVGVLYARWRRMPVRPLADLVAPTLMLGLSLGRIGCFFAGCCHGAACPVPDGAVNMLPGGFSGGALYLMSSPPFLLEEFHQGVGMNDTPMYPTHLWESLGAFLLFLLLSWRWRHRRYDGEVLVWLLATYPILRSTIELFRGDTIRGVNYLGLFSTSQLLSIPIFVLALVLALLWRHGGVTQPLQEDDDSELLDELGK
jgi:phosphatidylglycerol---prolipoprotein diacylglyceryl transferase